MKRYYPERVSDLWRAPNHSGEAAGDAVSGTGVALGCGVSVRFSLRMEGGTVLEARFVTNGCGWAVASAEALASKVSGIELRDLGGTETLDAALAGALGDIPPSRKECVGAAKEALTKALAAWRQRTVDEWKGEKALVCSCFGVAEETIEEAAEAGTVLSVADVGELCGAGTGCGSCQMLIREILEGS